MTLQLKIFFTRFTTFNGTLVLVIEVRLQKILFLYKYYTDITVKVKQVLILDFVCEIYWYFYFVFSSVKQK